MLPGPGGPASSSRSAKWPQHVTTSHPRDRGPCHRGGKEAGGRGPLPAPRLHAGSLPALAARALGTAVPRVRTEDSGFWAHRSPPLSSQLSEAWAPMGSTWGSSGLQRPTPCPPAAGTEAGPPGQERCWCKDAPWTLGAGGWLSPGSSGSFPERFPAGTNHSAEPSRA